MMSQCKSVLLAIGAMSLSTVTLFAQPKTATIYGADTPQAVVSALQTATKKDDVIATWALIAPAPRREFAAQIVSALLVFFRVADPDDREPGGTPLSKAELAAKRKAYRGAQDTARKTLKPYGLDKIIGRPAMAPETEQMIEAAVAKADTVMLLQTMVGLTDQVGPTLGMKRGDRPTVPLALGAVSSYQIDGDRATARTARETLEFQRVELRWYLSSSSMLRTRR